MPSIQKGSGSGKSAGNNAEKELQKLRRMDLLELLLDAMRDNERYEAETAELNELVERLKAKLDEKDETFDRLKEKLDEKDEVIERLKAKLDEKDALVEKIRRDSIEIAKKRGELDLDGLIEAQRAAAEEFLRKTEDEIQQAAARQAQALVGGAVEPAGDADGEEAAAEEADGHGEAASADAAEQD